MGGWECPISSIVMRMVTASWQFKNKAPNSASAADVMMLRSILHTTYTIPFSVGFEIYGIMWSRGFVAQEVHSSCSAFCFWAGQVGGIAMNPQDHVTSCVPYGRIWFCREVI